MSDTAQGPGWWQASNGKWYSPELHPDYRPPPPPPSVLNQLAERPEPWPPTKDSPHYGKRADMPEYVQKPGGWDR